MHLQQIKHRHRSLDKQGEAGPYNDNPIHNRLQKIACKVKTGSSQTDILQYNKN